MSYRASHLLAVAAGAVLVTAVFLVTLPWTLEAMVANPGAIHDFFFRRSVIQWYTLAAFFFAVIILVHRVILAIRLQRAVRALRDKSTSKSTLHSLIGRRIERLREAKKGGGPAAAAEREKEMAEADEAELSRTYALLGGAIQLMLAFGFYGTVWGISSQLFSSFGGITSLSTADLKGAVAAFTKALGTALDTTVLGMIGGMAIGVSSAVMHWLEASGLRAIDAIIRERLPSAPGGKDAGQAAWLVEERLPEVSRELVAATEAALRALVEKSGEILEEKLSEIARAVAERLEGDTRKMADELAGLVGDQVAERVGDVVAADGEKSRDAITGALESLEEKLDERPQVVLKYPGRSSRLPGVSSANGVGA